MLNHVNMPVTKFGMIASMGSLCREYVQVCGIVVVLLSVDVMNGLPVFEVPSDDCLGDKDLLHDEGLGCVGSRMARSEPEVVPPAVVVTPSALPEWAVLPSWEIGVTLLVAESAQVFSPVALVAVGGAVLPPSTRRLEEDATAASTDGPRAVRCCELTHAGAGTEPSVPVVVLPTRDRLAAKLAVLLHEGLAVPRMDRPVSVVAGATAENPVVVDGLELPIAVLADECFHKGTITHGLTDVKLHAETVTP